MQDTTLIVKRLRVQVTGQGLQIASAADLKAAAASYTADCHAAGWGDPAIDWQRLGLHYVIACTLLDTAEIQGWTPRSISAQGIVPVQPTQGRVKPNLRDVMAQANAWVDLSLDDLIGPGKAPNNVNNLFTLAQAGERPSPAVTFGTAGRVGWVTLPGSPGKRGRRFYRRA